jgi:hypothetical protein
VLANNPHLAGVAGVDIEEDKERERLMIVNVEVVSFRTRPNS